MRTFLDVHCWLFAVKVTSSYFHARIYGYAVLGELDWPKLNLTFCNKSLANFYRH